MNVTVSVHEDANLAKRVRELALEGYEGPAQPRSGSRERYVWLRETGSRLWLDTGDAAAAERVWSDELDALTTNNTLVNQVIQTGAMDGLIAYGARALREVRPDITEHDLVIELAFLVNAKLALNLVGQFGAHVSVELHPAVAHDVTSTLTFARRYYSINPDFFYVKVPLTPDGYIATRLLSAEGIPVNFTLGFSARQNYLAARFAKPAYVNVFLGRLNQLVEENKLGNPENVGEKVTIASDDWIKDIRRSSDTPTQQIGASLRGGRQVAALAGVDVLTIPPKAAEEYLAMDLSKDDVSVRDWRDITVELDPARDREAGELARLWTVDKDFVSFVEDAIRQGDALRAGDDLKALSVRHGVQLFYPWTEKDMQVIREKGKIPNLSEWPGVPVDDLMTVSGLASFAKDQQALDDRIAEVMRDE